MRQLILGTSPLSQTKHILYSEVIKVRGNEAQDLEF